MTLVYNTDSRAIQQVQFGVNELFSAIVLGKTVGSFITRQHDAAIFRNLHDACHVRVTKVPNWLRNMQFTRSTSIYGSNMRFVQGRQATLMEDVSIDSLEGFAATVVLCCRYAEPLDSVVAAVESLILGKLTKSVHPGDLEGAQSRLYTSWKPLLRTWIQGVKSSDADSVQSSTTMKWLVELAGEGVSVKLSNTFARTRQFNLDLLADLLGSEDTRAGQWGENIILANGESVQQRVYDTMSTGAASIGISAAANGADVSVLCLTRNGSKLISSNTKNPTQYLIRLWLKQPPPLIYQNLQSSPSDLDENIEDTQSNLYARNIVYGGEKEIALSIAQELGYWDGDEDVIHRVLALWTAGIRKGKSLTWFIKPFQHPQEQDIQVVFSPHVYFMIKDHNPSELPGLHVDELANSIATRDKPLRPLSREIACILHEEYQLREYIKCTPADKEVFKAASDFVQIAITIGSLHNLICHLDNSYSLNLSAITTRGSFVTAASLRTGELQKLLPDALNCGVGHNAILWAAALLWGGASLASQGNTPIGDHVLGVVAPQCTIILDFIRDPLSLARHGLSAPLLSIYRGAVPLLGQDPRSGLVLAQRRSRSQIRPTSKINCYDIRQGQEQRSTVLPDPGDLLITFETGFGEAITDNIFIAWYKGDMAFELDPKYVFDNLLMRRCIPASQSQTPLQIETLPYCLDFTELMQQPNFYIESGPAVFLAGSDPAWLVAAAGSSNEIGIIVISDGRSGLEKAANSDLIVICEI